MKSIHFILIIVCVILLNSCKQEATESQKSSVIWAITSIETSPKMQTNISTTIVNNLDRALTKDNWSLQYNHIGGAVDVNSIPQDITIVNKNGDFFILSPTEKFESLAPGEQRTYTYPLTGHLDKMSETPRGMFMVVEGIPLEIDFEVLGLNEETLAPLNPTTAATRFKKNERLSLLKKEDLLPIIPRPHRYQYLNEVKVLGSITSINYSEGIANEIRFLKDGLSKIGIETTSSDQDADITVALNVLEDIPNEGYLLRVDKSGIDITATSHSGIFYGIQSLLQYLNYAKLENTDGQLEIRGIDIEDQPRFDYRGMLLDVARNFHSKENVKRILDGMSSFKLNKFHFHITDDEGWRLEIPDLPELTEIGSKRGYSENENEMLMPSYGSGYGPDKSYGSGFYNKQEFIEILKYAKDRHIEVITEVDVPGHARAAIKSMIVRHDRLKAKGRTEEAEKYLLHDPEDQSEYRSAQNWNDNVMCICRQGTYNFMEKVFQEVVNMYKEAGAPLNSIHIGGDEMPFGAWQKSPLCDKFIEEDPNLESAYDLPQYFFNKMSEVMKKHNLVTSGWEDMTIAHNEHGHNSIEVDMSLLKNNVRPYVWNAIIGGGRDDMIYKLANLGFPVVMCNSSAFYFDMSYDRDPDEIGLSWSGYSDTETAFGVEPLNIFHGTPKDGNGQELSKEYLADREKITNKGKSNFLGIQAQLWSETILKESSLEYLIYPKLLGFSERAWAPRGKWVDETDAESIETIYNNEWNLFANTLGQKTLPLLDTFLDGINYRIPEPGAIIEDGRLKVNTSFPGLSLEYADGPENLKYINPTEVSEENKISVWSQSKTGRMGRRAEIKQ